MTRVAVAAPNTQSADAAVAIVEAGGNAVDAAVAAAAVAMVNEIGIVSPSAGGFITMLSAGSDPVTIDGWMDMPGRDGTKAADGATRDVWTEYGGGVEITIGAGSVATHGAIAALGEAHARAGALPWSELFGPAIEIARNGVILGSASRFYLNYVHETVFGWDPVSHAALHDVDGTVKSGPVVVPGLAETLERIAANGPAEMHTGETARAIAADVRERGGLLGLDDLADYRTVLRPSVPVRTRDWSWGTNPPPALGGVVLAAMLTLMDGTPLADREQVVKVQRRVLSQRLEVFDHSVDLERDAAAFLDAIAQDPRAVLESGSTVHVSTVDETGNACSVTISSGYSSGMIAKDTGIWLNNCLGEQELNPRGLHGSAPGTRLLSNMAPTVGRRDDGTVMAVGSPGADRITTAIFQTLTGFMNDRLGLQEAVDHPRVHVHRAARPDEEIKVEEELNMYYGGVGAALLHPDGTLEAAADPRRTGSARIASARRDDVADGADG